MKKFLVSMLIVFLVAAAPAPAVSAVSVELDVYCKSIERFAASAMSARQAGVMPSKLLEVLLTESEHIRIIARAIVMDAYASPRFLTPEYVKRAIEEFSVKWFVWCVNN